MRSIFVIFCIVLLAISGVIGCKPPGLPCSTDADCCGPLICNQWAGRCTKKMGPNQPDDSQSPTNNKQP